MADKKEDKINGNMYIIEQIILSIKDIKGVLYYCESNKYRRSLCKENKVIRNHILTLMKGVKREDIEKRGNIVKLCDAISYIHGKRIYHGWLNKTSKYKANVTIFAPKKEYGKNYTVSYDIILKKKPTEVPKRPPTI